jgi:SAM-dependent methyltransferase
MNDRTESQYYAFREFDYANAHKVLSHYVGYFTEGPVLELACGPGVFLDLLNAAGISARGVDLDPGMVEQAAERGHEVVLDDALAYLKSVQDASLGGLFAAHFIEHLPSEVAAGVYTEAARVLRPGGVFVAAVPNAACLSVLGYDFWRDPTHVRFYDPVALEFFARQAGLEVTDTGGNPLNHPGAPGQLHNSPAESFADLKQDLNQVLDGIQAAADQEHRRFRQPHEDPRTVLSDTVQRLVHLIGVLDDRLQVVQHQLVSQQTAYQRLLEELYPPNETYVVARRPAPGRPSRSPEA